MTINSFFESIDQKKINSSLLWDIETALIETDPGKIDKNWFIPMSFFDDNCLKAIEYCIDPKSYEEIGEHCVKASKVANYKYGENKAKLLEQIGVVTIDTTVSPNITKTTKLGSYLLSLNSSSALSIMVRISVGIPVLHYLLSNANNDQIGISSVFPDSFKPSTIKRRSSSIMHMLKDIGFEYHCEELVLCLLSEMPSKTIEQVKRESFNNDFNLMIGIINKRINNHHLNSEEGGHSSNIVENENECRGTKKIKTESEKCESIIITGSKSVNERTVSSDTIYDGMEISEKKKQNTTIQYYQNKKDDIVNKVSGENHLLI